MMAKKPNSVLANAMIKGTEPIPGCSLGLTYDRLYRAYTREAVGIGIGDGEQTSMLDHVQLCLPCAAYVGTTTNSKGRVGNLISGESESEKRRPRRHHRSLDDKPPVMRPSGGGQSPT